MTLEEAKQTLRRVFIIYDDETGQAWFNHSREEAQAAADVGKLAIEYGYIGRIKGANDKMVPVNET